MVTRAETLEKLIGRRAVSCLGILLLLFLIVVILALLRFGTTNPDKPQPAQIHNAAPATSN